jgi:hypothetical protein
MVARKVGRLTRIVPNSPGFKSGIIRSDPLASRTITTKRGNMENCFRRECGVMPVETHGFLNALACSRVSEITSTTRDCPFEVQNETAKMLRGKSAEMGCASDSTLRQTCGVKQLQNEN